MRLKLAGPVTGMIVLLGVGTAIGQSRFDAELQNLRALPFGYTSWCEDGNLVFKSHSSARFRITEAGLCVGNTNER